MVLRPLPGGIVARWPGRVKIFRGPGRTPLGPASKRWAPGQRSAGTIPSCPDDATAPAQRRPLPRSDFWFGNFLGKKRQGGCFLPGDFLGDKNGMNNILGLGSAARIKHRGAMGPISAFGFLICGWSAIRGRWGLGRVAGGRGGGAPRALCWGSSSRALGRASRARAGQMSTGHRAA